MLLGLSARYDCDHPDCRETGATPLPAGSEHLSHLASALALVKAIVADGWFMGPRGIHCFKHKPRDWDSSDVVDPSRPVKLDS